MGIAAPRTPEEMERAKAFDAGWNGATEEAAAKIERLRAEVNRLREYIVMADNRLETAHSGNNDVCRACVDVARSYLQAALANEQGEK